MKKILIFVLSIVMVASLTACGNGKKAQEAYDAIGNMSFSDESILTEEEKATLESLKTDREQALSEKDVEKLNAIKNEWESFKTPIEKYIGKYDSVAETFFSNDEKALLTADELSEYETLQTNISDAYRSRNESQLDDVINEYNDAFGALREVIEEYTSIDQNPLSENEKSLLSNDTVAKYEELKTRTEDSFSERDLAVLKSLKSEWYTFTDNAKSEIEAAKEKMLNDWVSGANVTNSLTNLFSFGTITSSTSIDNHTITSTTQYNYDVDTSEIKNALESYLSWTSSVFEGGIRSLKPYIDDICIRVEYKDKNGSVICYKEFQ